MANRFQSIIDGLTVGVLNELAILYPDLSNNLHWYIKDGELRAQHNGNDDVFVFEKGDPDSEAFILLLNNMPKLIQSFIGSRK